MTPQDDAPKVTTHDSHLDTLIHKLFDRGVFTPQERDVLLQTNRYHRMPEETKKAILEKYRESEHPDTTKQPSPGG